MKYAVRCALSLFVGIVVVGPASAAAPPGRVDPARVKVLLRKLDAESFFTRQRADQALRAMGKPVLPLLRAERERTKSLEVRDRIDRMVRDLTYDEQIAGLVRLLGHTNRQYREHADRALRQAGADVVPILKNELKGEMGVEGRARLEKIIAALSAQQR
jgi:hypothetical protein